MTATRRPATQTGPSHLDDPELAFPGRAIPDLEENLEAIVEEHETCALEVVLETARALQTWTQAWPGGPDGRGTWDAEQLGRALERGWTPWLEAHGWRGPCAQFADSVRRTWWRFGPLGTEELQSALTEEIGLWTWSVEEGLERFGEHDVPWNGEPLARGRRMPLRREAARHAAATLGRGETVLVTAWSDTIAQALELAWQRGKAPRLLMSECLPLLDGRRMARRLVREGVLATLVYDASLATAVTRADRVWVPAEALGAREFTTRTGTRHLIEMALDHDVPVELVTTSDKLVPGGELESPRWCARRPELLWEDAGEGIDLELGCYEPVPLELVPRPITELGRESVVDLSLRALRSDAAPPCSTFTREPS